MGIAWLAGLVLACGPALAVAQATLHRVGVAAFEVPKGWSLQAAGGTATLTALDRPAESAVRIEIADLGASEQTIDQLADAYVASLRERVRGLEGMATRSSGFRAARGGDWRAVSGTYEDPDRAGQFIYESTVIVAGGGHAVRLSLRASDRAGFDQHTPDLTRLSDTLRLNSLVTLWWGQPPLTLAMSDQVSDFVEWLIGTALSAEQRKTIQAELTSAWTSGDREEIDGVVELIKARAELARQTPAERELARQGILEAALAEWRKDRESASAKMILSIHDAAHRPIAAGDPPLTRQSAEAFARFLYFTATQVAGVKRQPEPELIEQSVKGLVELYPTLAAEHRETVSRMPLIWAAFDAGWDALAPAEREAMVAQWRDAPAVAQLAEALRAQQAEADRQAAAAQATNELAELQRKQAAMGAMQNHYRMMNQVMQSTFDSQRMMISNLGGNTQYTYQYRW
jgi:uncharacterized protein YbaA (DUF1428 family)